jgi:Concanavalin A-like lectin/glucanases superfamily
MVAVAVTGCGRIGYEPPVDADADLFDPSVGCVVYLPMDEAAWSGAANEVHDACGGHDGRAVGGATTVLDPVRGQVGSFPGGAGCVQIADQPGLHPTDALTISAWLRPQSLDGSQEYGVVSKRADYEVDTVYSVFVWTGDKLWADLATENDRFAAEPPLTDGQWQQVTVVYDGQRPAGARVEVYRDGAAPVVAADADATLPDFATDLHVGCLPLGAPAQGFVGALDDVAIWHRALTAAEVAAWYQHTLR